VSGNPRACRFEPEFMLAGSNLLPCPSPGFCMVSRQAAQDLEKADADDFSPDWIAYRMYHQTIRRGRQIV
jgi:hypothetical protein